MGVVFWLSPGVSNGMTAWHDDMGWLEERFDWEGRYDLTGRFD